MENKILKLEDRFKLTDLNQLRKDENKPFGRLIVDTISLVDRSIKYENDIKRMKTFEICDLEAYSNLYGIDKEDALYNINLVRRVNGLEDLTFLRLNVDYHITGGDD